MNQFEDTILRLWIIGILIKVEFEDSCLVIKKEVEIEKGARVICRREVWLNDHKQTVSSKTYEQLDSIVRNCNP